MVNRLKIYTFVEDAVWYQCMIQKRNIVEIDKAYSSQYRVRLTTYVSFDAAYFQQAIAAGQSVLGLIGFIVNQNEIIEIDDGYEPVFFCLQANRLLPVCFDKAKMRRISA